MRRLYLSAVNIAALAMSLMLASCTTLFSTSSFAPSDLYRTDNRVQVANELRAEAEAQRAEAEAREAQYLAMQAEAEAQRAEADYYASLDEPSYSSIIANDYESAYARRLYGFNSPTYRLPSSYYNLSTSRELTYAMAYDPAFYNIMVSGDQVWVEPKYITSMFGSWGATNVTFGIYSSPWNYGWAFNHYPCYYSWWGYPHYSWYDWNWNICYNPWYYDWHWGYPHYGHHHHYNPGYGPGRPPQHRPGNRPTDRPNTRPNHGYASSGSGASAGAIIGNLNGGRGTTGSRYTSPVTDKNHGAVTITDNKRPVAGGTISTGVNTGSSFRGSGIKVDNTLSPSRGDTASGSNKRGTVGSSSSSGRNTGNFRQGGTTSRGSSTVSSGSSSSSSRGGTTSSQRGSSSYRSNSSSSSSSNRNSTLGNTRGSFSGSSSSSSSGGGSSRGGSTSSRR